MAQTLRTSSETRLPASTRKELVSDLLVIERRPEMDLRAHMIYHISTGMHTCTHSMN